ncbi:SDR family NAD(P)-dependent oxidoreductase [Hansschlegelia beijingensis]|uniref:NAD(P)-dependent dehydrogenase (Short-subunit alcohol dehydrogenase family) n=1 Tax=Hansschlegelia beijingensis TaxID=1133344 RepID=A0A7W6GG51_9HYPH|nr:SDR family oxidoreductase [Hansschlegelia beijingensis]MBB3973637.1 NAD(P)-dependent dehydrogenase (short-subunit alcohol dehydrogenase family) [Hansschlegelia beijingensis]
MSNSLEGKIAVVTGGSTGIGLGIAKRFVSEGATVVITGRRQAELDAAVAEIGPKASAFRADVAVLADLDALYAEVERTHGRIDVVVANAGGGSLAKLGEITEEHFDSTFAINVKGVLFTVQKALPLMRNGGSVIVTGSTTSIMGTEAFSVYSGTKAAIRNFVRSWILDLKGRNIRVNVLSPGPIDTPALRGVAEQAEGLIDYLTSQVPLGRIGDADETGKVAVFLASDASSFVNGAELFVDGGMAQV